MGLADLFSSFSSPSYPLFVCLDVIQHYVPVLLLFSELSCVVQPAVSSLIFFITPTQQTMNLKPQEKTSGTNLSG